jgi:hypothetical protein
VDERIDQSGGRMHFSAGIEKQPSKMPMGSLRQKVIGKQQPKKATSFEK